LLFPRSAVRRIGTSLPILVAPQSGTTRKDRGIAAGTAAVVAVLVPVVEPLEDVARLIEGAVGGGAFRNMRPKGRGMRTAAKKKK